MQGMQRFPLAATTPRTKRPREQWVSGQVKQGRDVIRVNILPVLCLSGVLLCVHDGGKEVGHEPVCILTKVAWILERIEAVYR
eukprot:11713567-Ditylum_brightwellii.AAC.1